MYIRISAISWKYIQFCILITRILYEGENWLNQLHMFHIPSLKNIKTYIAQQHYALSYIMNYISRFYLQNMGVCCTLSVFLIANEVCR
jgi:hypothetical protein